MKTQLIELNVSYAEADDRRLNLRSRSELPQRAWFVRDLRLRIRPNGRTRFQSDQNASADQNTSKPSYLLVLPQQMLGAPDRAQVDDPTSVDDLLERGGNRQGPLLQAAHLLVR